MFQRRAPFFITLSSSNTVTWGRIGKPCGHVPQNVAYVELDVEMSISEILCVPVYGLVQRGKWLICLDHIVVLLIRCTVCEGQGLRGNSTGDQQRDHVYRLAQT